MSRINELKEKSKKHLEANERRKMGLGELFENQTVGNPATHQDGNPEIKPTNQPSNQKITNPANPSSHQTAYPTNQQDGQAATHPPGRFVSQSYVNPEDPPVKQPSIFPGKQPKNQKISTCKMTFNLREDIHKAFTDLYANRILQGRATEKSEMICEAIQLLINMEEQIR